MNYVSSKEIREGLGIKESTVYWRTTITLTMHDMEFLVAEAERMHIKPSAFVRMAVLEQLAGTKQAMP